MDQRSILPYLAWKGLAAVAIYEDLVAALEAETINYPSVTRYLREAKFATSNPEVTLFEPIREHDDCNQAILLALDEQPFASISSLERLTHPARTTVHQCVTQSLGSSPMGPSLTVGRSKIKSDRTFASTSICIKDPTG
jgi:hypothetical protein